MKISDVLINTEKKQIIGKLATWTVGEPDSTPNAYCALGVLACEKGMIKNVMDVEKLGYTDILYEYGIDPHIYVKMPEDPNNERQSIIEYYIGKQYQIYDAIWKLNDSYKWSFKRIGEWIKSLEDDGVIEYG